MSSSHADTGICRTRTENDIYVSEKHFFVFLDALDAGNPVRAVEWFLDHYKERHFENPSFMEHSSKSPYLQLSVILRKIHANFPDCWKKNVVEKGMQLWLCMENKLSQETEEPENLLQMLEEMCHEAVAELATDSELRIRKHQEKRGSLEISGEPIQKGDESGHEAVERQVTDSALPIRTKQDDDADPLYKTENDKDYYDNVGKKGYLLILNSKSNRSDTDKDVSNIKNFFEDKLRFEVDDPRSYESADLSTESLTQYLEAAQDKLASPMSSKYYCFICIILYHGNEDGIATSNGIKSVEDIQKMFSNDKVPRFAGKPKLFFIQACRGLKGTDHVDVDDEADDTLEDEADEIIKVPHEADTLVAYATTLGKKAFRRKNVGSWFISEMMEEFDKNYVRDHVEEMLITVRQRVASMYSPNHNSMQMPCVQSTLTRRVKFHRLGQ